MTGCEYYYVQCLRVEQKRNRHYAGEIENGNVKKVWLCCRKQMGFQALPCESRVAIHFTEQWIIYYRGSQNIAGVMK